MKTKQVIMAIVICILCALSIAFAILGQSEIQVITNPSIQIEENIDTVNNLVNEVDTSFEENINSEISTSTEVEPIENQNTEPEVSSSTPVIDNSNAI